MTTKIFIEYIAGLGDALIDIPYFKKYIKENPSHEIHIHCDNTIQEIFNEFCKEIKVVEVSDNRNFDPSKIDSKFKNAYDQHKIINGLLSWAFYIKSKTPLWKQRGECFFPNINIVEDELHIDPKTDVPLDIFNDFKNPVIFNASKPFLSAQGKALSKDMWDSIINSFTNITFIQIGSSNTDYTFSQDNVINLRDKPIVIALSLIPFAKFLIGTDNVLNHASKCFRKQGIFFWGSNSPEQYGYAQNINLYNPKDCSPCLHNRAGSKSYCCQHPHIDTIELNEILDSIKKLLKET